MGLKLATGWQDGIVRIYEAMDVMNLSQWSLMGEFDATSKSNKEESGCHLSWNPSSFDPPSMVVGCADGSLKVNFLFFYNKGNLNLIEFYLDFSIL